MKKKKAYVILCKTNSRIYGAFPRDAKGKKDAKAYKDKLQKKTELKLIIK